MLRLGVLVSGRGSNLQALLDAASRGELSAEVAVVISNKPGVKALERAAGSNVPARVIDHHGFDSREAFEQALIRELDKHRVDLVCLAGFMRVLTAGFVRRYPGRILNIHPALLPAFKGLYGGHVHEAVIASGVKFSGCTVHFVTEDVDGGPILLQRVVPVLDTDDPATLAARVLEQEHKAYPEAVQLVAQDRIRIQGRRTLLQPGVDRD
jgi:phosphoribosylglycinamide formyltransferase-1